MDQSSARCLFVSTSPDMAILEGERRCGCCWALFSIYVQASTSWFCFSSLCPFLLSSSQHDARLNPIIVLPPIILHFQIASCCKDAHQLVNVRHHTAHSHARLPVPLLGRVVGSVEINGGVLLFVHQHTACRWHHQRRCSPSTKRVFRANILHQGRHDDEPRPRYHNHIIIVAIVVVRRKIDGNIQVATDQLVPENRGLQVRSKGSITHTQQIFWLAECVLCVCVGESFELGLLQ